MQLFYSPNSPYARKCRVIIIEKGLENKVDLRSLMPSDNPPELVAANPLGTVPTLVLGSGEALCESPVICEYLDSLSEKKPFFPSDKNARFSALSLAALADGIMDAAVACVMEGRRPEEKRYQQWVERKENAVKRTIAKIAGLGLNENSPWNIGTLNTAIALEYVSFRLPHITWEKEHEGLKNWLKTASQKPAMLATKPA